MTELICSNEAGDFTVFKDFALVRVQAYDEPATSWLERWGKETRGQYIPALRYKWQRLCLDIGVYLPESSRIKARHIDALLELSTLNASAIFIVVHHFSRIQSIRFYRYITPKGQKKWYAIKDTWKLRKTNRKRKKRKVQKRKVQKREETK